MSCCDILSVFDEKNNLIKEYKYWRLLIRNKSMTLGNCVAITKRHMEAFSEITPEEMVEFAHVVKDIESALKKSFSYNKINYLMYMMKDRHTHFHIIPRYETPRQFAGIEWKDEAWPKAPVEREAVHPKILQLVKQKITENLSK